MSTCPSRRLPLFGGADLGIAVLPVDAAQGRIIIERVALQFVEIVKMLSARVDHIRAPGSDARIGRRCAADKGQRVHRHVDDRADRVARIRRTEQRQLDKRAFSDAPNRQGLAKIGLVRRQPQFIGHIEDAGDPGRRIDREPLNRFPGLLDIPLQCVVDGDGGLFEVLHDVVDTLLHAFRHMVGVRLGDRPHDRMIGGDISLEDRPVDRLRRIMLGIGVIRARSHREARRRIRRSITPTPRRPPNAPVTCLRDWRSEQGDGFRAPEFLRTSSVRCSASERRADLPQPRPQGQDDGNCRPVLGMFLRRGAVKRGRVDRR